MTDLLCCVGWCESNAKYLLVERWGFNNRLQESDKSIDADTTALRTLTETCEFGSLRFNSRLFSLWYQGQQSEEKASPGTEINLGQMP